LINYLRGQTSMFEHPVHALAKRLIPSLALAPRAMHATHRRRLRDEVGMRQTDRLICRGQPSPGRQRLGERTLLTIKVGTAHRYRTSSSPSMGNSPAGVP
jgi:hypothetical protein